VRRLFIVLCVAAPAALLIGCADLSRPEQITVVAEKPAAPPAPAAPVAPTLERGQAMGAMPAGQGAPPQARAGGG
jgi:hypothetical protein